MQHEMMGKKKWNPYNRKVENSLAVNDDSKYWDPDNNRLNILARPRKSYDDNVKSQIENTKSKAASSNKSGNTSGKSKKSKKEKKSKKDSNMKAGLSSGSTKSKQTTTSTSSKKGKKSITNVASSFSKEKVVKPFVISPNALRYKATPRILELAKPLSRKSDL